MSRLRARRRRGHRGSVGPQAAVPVFLRATGRVDPNLLAGGRYSGLALGAEFCHRRLPSPADVVGMADRCRGLGKGFSLVTPLVREGAFDPVTRWLATLAERIPGAEWVANDWGLLAWGRDAGLPLRPVAGRLLGRQRRGPRALDLLLRALPAGASALRGSLWDAPEAAGLLRDLGVERVELDLLLQGVRRPMLPPGLHLSLCGPWVPVTLTPACPWSSDPLRCPTSCAGEEPVRLTNEENPNPLWSRGNALFLDLGSRPSERVLAALGADRLVWAEAPPG